MLSTSADAETDLEVGRRIELSRELAQDIHLSSARRRSVPVRSVFSRDLTGQASAPMARLVRVGGRGGAVLLKLYLALIWRSSAAPFDTAIPARKWAELLALQDPAVGGARRIADALKTLESQQLISIERRRGEASRVTLLHESGSGETYSLPRGGSEDLYFQVPARMWLTGELQQLSAPGLAMLMAVLAEQARPGARVWWSTTRFPGRFGLSAATRSRGTKELVEAELLQVTREAVSLSGSRSFAADRVRKIYAVKGSALLEEASSEKPAGTALSTSNATSKSARTPAKNIRGGPAASKRGPAARSRLGKSSGKPRPD